MIYTVKTPPFVSIYVFHATSQVLKKSDKTFAQTPPPPPLQWWDSRRSFRFYFYPVWTKEGHYKKQQIAPGKNGISYSGFALMDDSKLEGKIKK